MVTQPCALSLLFFLFSFFLKLRNMAAGFLFFFFLVAYIVLYIFVAVKWQEWIFITIMPSSFLFWASVPLLYQFLWRKEGIEKSVGAIISFYAHAVILSVVIFITSIVIHSNSRYIFKNVENSFNTFLIILGETKNSGYRLVLLSFCLLLNGLLLFFIISYNHLISFPQKTIHLHKHGRLSLKTWKHMPSH